MSSRTVRPARPDEYAVVSRLLTLTHPHDPTSPEDLTQQLADQDRWGYHAGCLLLSEDGRPVGAAMFSQSLGAYHPRRFLARVGVDPQCQRRGLGGQLWRTVVERLVALGAQSVRVTAREDHPDAPGFVQRRGGVADHWFFTSALSLDDFRPEAHQDALRRCEASGIRLVDLTRLRGQQFPDLNRRLCALMNEVRLDVPRSEPATPLSQDLFDKAVLGDFGLIPEGYVLAERGGQLLGQTTLFTNGESEDLFTGLTGVVRACRGQGVATALKVQALRVARAHGARRVITDNASTNTGMLAVNDRLGFVRDPATASYLVPVPAETRHLGEPPVQG